MSYRWYFESGEQDGGDLDRPIASPEALVAAYALEFGGCSIDQTEKITGETGRPGQLWRGWLVTEGDQWRLTMELFGDESGVLWVSCDPSEDFETPLPYESGPSDASRLGDDVIWRALRILPEKFQARTPGRDGALLSVAETIERLTR